MVSQLSIIVSKELYIKDPISSELGEKILSQGLILMHEIGLEDFNFKKLSQKINSTESTIYRYFESKNQFLFYLFNYYWSWMDYKLALAVANIEDPKTRLKKAINLVTKTVDDDLSTNYINENLLQQVIMVESSKTFLSKKVDEENKLGYFKLYKNFITNLSTILLEINPRYPYYSSLVSTINESVFHQRFFSQHLPKLTNNISQDEQLEDFFFQLCLQTITNYNENGKNESF